MALKETLSQAVNGRGVTAEIYYDSGPTVTVKIVGNAGYGAQSHWRITGTNSGGDYSTHYIPVTDASSGSFTAENGHNYALQAVWGEYNGVSAGAIFTVNFESNGGNTGGNTGGSSSGGGPVVDDTKEYYLWVKYVDGISTTVYRYDEYGDTWIDETENLFEGWDGGLWHGLRIYPWDVFYFEIKAEGGYTLEDVHCEGLQYNEEYSVFYFDPDVDIIASADS